MGHLTTETLARLVDEAPRADEAAHLAECRVCALDLEALRAQTRGLASLPEIRPPLGDWQVLEARLQSEGLIEVPSLLSRLSLARTPSWMRAAAAIALFLGGGVLGSAMTSRSAGLGTAGAPGQTQSTAVDDEDLDQAATAVRLAEQEYVEALTRYRQLLGRQGGDLDAGDPISRMAALEYLVAAGQAAVRQAPADPFLNGLLASTLAERDAVMRRISTRQDNWF